LKTRQQHTARKMAPTAMAATDSCGNASVGKRVGAPVEEVDEDDVIEDEEKDEQVEEVEADEDRAEAMGNENERERKDETVTARLLWLFGSARCDSCSGPRWRGSLTQLTVLRGGHD
jgi:hypothetical protein